MQLAILYFACFISDTLEIQATTPDSNENYNDLELKRAFGLLGGNDKKYKEENKEKRKEDSKSSKRQEVKRGNQNAGMQIQIHKINENQVQSIQDKNVKGGNQKTDKNVSSTKDYIDSLENVSKSAFIKSPIVHGEKNVTGLKIKVNSKKEEEENKERYVLINTNVGELLLKKSTTLDSDENNADDLELKVAFGLLGGNDKAINDNLSNKNDYIESNKGVSIVTSIKSPNGYGETNIAGLKSKGKSIKNKKSYGLYKTDDDKILLKKSTSSDSNEDYANDLELKREFGLLAVKNKVSDRVNKVGDSEGNQQSSDTNKTKSMLIPELPMVNININNFHQQPKNLNANITGENINIGLGQNGMDYEDINGIPNINININNYLPKNALGTLRPRWPSLLAHARQKVNYIVGLKALRLAFFMGYG